MPTVTFLCEHCHNLMGISQEYLGQQVRCPHCQQVVTAPASIPPPEANPLVPSFPIPNRDEQESIFSSAQESGDDLFGEEPTSQVELPPLEPRPAAAESPSETGSFSLPDTEKALFPSTEEPEFSLPHQTPAEDSGPILSGSQGAAAAVAARSAPGVWFYALLVVPLISYSILSTIVIIYLKTHQSPHPLEMLPDLEGDGKGATRGKSSSLHYDIHFPEKDLPRHLLVPLGGTLAVGDLEVTPCKVEKRRITLRTKGSTQADTPLENCLAVELRLRNRSADVFFKPMDRFFTRTWKPNSGGSGAMPFTMLLMGAAPVFRRPHRVEVESGQGRALPGTHAECGWAKLRQGAETRRGNDHLRLHRSGGSRRPGTGQVQRLPLVADPGASRTGQAAHGARGRARRPGHGRRRCGVRCRRGSLDSASRAQAEPGHEDMSPKGKGGQLGKEGGLSGDLSASRKPFSPPSDLFLFFS